LCDLSGLVGCVGMAAGRRPGSGGRWRGGRTRVIGPASRPPARRADAGDRAGVEATGAVGQIDPRRAGLAGSAAGSGGLGQIVAAIGDLAATTGHGAGHNPPERPNRGGGRGVGQNCGSRPRFRPARGGPSRFGQPNGFRWAGLIARPPSARPLGTAPRHGPSARPRGAACPRGPSARSPHRQFVPNRSRPSRFGLGCRSQRQLIPNRHAPGRFGTRSRLRPALSRHTAATGAQIVTDPSGPSVHDGLWATSQT
jgi:hypothetical protein